MYTLRLRRWLDIFRWISIWWTNCCFVILPKLSIAKFNMLTYVTPTESPPSPHCYFIILFFFLYYLFFILLSITSHRISWDCNGNILFFVSFRLFNWILNSIQSFVYFFIHFSYLAEFFFIFGLFRNSTIQNYFCYLLYSYIHTKTILLL